MNYKILVKKADGEWFFELYRIKPVASTVESPRDPIQTLIATSVNFSSLAEARREAKNLADESKHVIVNDPTALA